MNKETRAYVLFSNINVLFSGAYRPDAALRRRILPSARLITSVYAAEEARRNLLSTPVQRRELEELLGSVEIVLTVASTGHPLFSALELPDKDRPMLLAAISAGATRLLSGGFRHFGPYCEERIEGVLVLPLGDYLSSRTE